jgi:hypothetical protein
MQPGYFYALLPLMVLPGCTVPDLRIQEVEESATGSEAPFSPRELPDAAVRTAQDEKPQAGRRAAPMAGTGGHGGHGGHGGRAGNSGNGGAASSGQSDASAGSAAGRGGMAGAAISGNGGSSGASPEDAGASMASDAGMPSEPEPDKPNPCLVWTRASSLDRAPANAVEGGLEITAGIESRQFVCRVQPPDLDYPVPGKAIFGNGCLVAYRINGAMKAHNQQNGSPFEVLTAGPGCTFSWQSADNSSVPSGAVDLSEPPRRKLYACHGDFQGPLSSGLQVGGVQGATDTPPRYECWFESYTSPMQPQNPTQFEVLVQAP